jgi:hypothetical protein
MSLVTRTTVTKPRESGCFFYISGDVEVPVDDRTKEPYPQQTLERTRLSKRGKYSKSLSKHRGSALSDFLYQMKKHNAAVVSASTKKRDAK